MQDQLGALESYYHRLYAEGSFARLVKSCCNLKNHDSVMSVIRRALILSNEQKTRR